MYIQLHKHNYIYEEFLEFLVYSCAIMILLILFYGTVVKAGKFVMEKEEKNYFSILFNVEKARLNLNNYYVLLSFSLEEERKR